jgi:hypothetical protein
VALGARRQLGGIVGAQAAAAGKHRGEALDPGLAVTRYRPLAGGGFGAEQVGRRGLHREEAQGRGDRDPEPLGPADLLFAAGLRDDLHDAVRGRLEGGEQALADVVEVPVDVCRRDAGNLRDLGAGGVHVPLLRQHLGGGAEEPPALVGGHLVGGDAVATGRKAELCEGTALSVGLPSHAAAD